jgi:hypothetical protein
MAARVVLNAYRLEIANLVTVVIVEPHDGVAEVGQTISHVHSKRLADTDSDHREVGKARRKC